MPRSRCVDQGGFSGRDLNFFPFFVTPCNSVCFHQRFICKVIQVVYYFDHEQGKVDLLCVWYSVTAEGRQCLDLPKSLWIDGMEYKRTANAMCFQAGFRTVAVVTEDISEPNNFYIALLISVSHGSNGPASHT